jgi:hypothetical protein
MGKAVVESGCGLCKVLYLHLPEKNWAKSRKLRSVSLSRFELVTPRSRMHVTNAAELQPASRVLSVYVRNAVISAMTLLRMSTGRRGKR